MSAIHAVGSMPVRDVRTAMFARRRFAVALIVLAIVALGALFAGRAVAGDPLTSGTRVVVVHEGETLSEIAAREMPQVANSEAVFELQDANNLNSMHVLPGQRLSIPG